MLPCRPGARSVSAGGIGRGRQTDATDGGSEKRKRRKSSMQALKECEVGLMFWSDRDNLDEIKSMGVRCGQLGIPGSADLGHHFVEDWKKALADEKFTVVTVIAAYNGESYADIPTV